MDKRQGGQEASSLDQRYLDPAPDGIDAREAWSRAGGRGEGVFTISPYPCTSTRLP